MSDEPVGTFCLVLHSHLPWLAHHGAWPVGEEWLYQAWAQSYLPVLDVLHRLAAEGRRDVLTLGVTPVLAAQLDDPYCLQGMHAWLGSWLLRAHQAAARRADPPLQALAGDEHRAAGRALADFESRWRHGASPVLRPLVDTGAVELLGGPATHSFQPLLAPRVRDFALRSGLADAALRLGRRPVGVWAPECGYAPGMAAEYAAAGVARFVVDGPALRGDTAFARPVHGSGVVCLGRDLAVSYRVWSPRSGYPGGAHYRDFHTFDHRSGLKPARVTGRRVAPADKRPYDPVAAWHALQTDVADFVGVVRRRLAALAARHGRPALTVAAFDTELFGHWWHEGPMWLEAVLRALPAAGVRVSTLGRAVQHGLVGAPVELGVSSWGSGKDWRVWDGARVSDLTSAGAEVQELLLSTVGESRPAPCRDRTLDQLAREALLALASDWAFMVTKGSAVRYARDRAELHCARVRELAGLLAAGRSAEAARVTGRWQRQDGLLGALDARTLRLAR